MTDYDFHQLNDKEFEELCNDLFSRKYNTDVERFKPGKDQGIDGRFFSVAGQKTIIQAKHYLKSGFGPLLKKLETNELESIKKLSPDRYILATSVSLSPLDKQKIIASLTPYVKRSDDIFGQDEINALISNDPETLKKHFKLWIKSTHVLQTILNIKHENKRKFELNQLIKKSDIFVETSAFKEAKSIIDHQNSIIITGAPGIGKTTISEQLALSEVAEGYSLCVIDEDISEFYDQYIEDNKQLFYYDDFLGDVILNLQKNKNKKLLKILNDIKKSNSKKFILTSRTYILNHAKEVYTEFNNENSSIFEFELTNQSLDRLDKAKILYNHLWHSDLSEEKINKIYLNKFYKKIIDHRNFNPRLISFITNNSRVFNVPSDRYCKYIVDTLENPSDIWKHYIETQMSKSDKDLVLTLALYGEPSIPEDTFKDIFYALDINDSTYNSTVERLINSTITRKLTENEEPKIELFDPSIRDFFYKSYAKEHREIAQIVLKLKNKKIISSLEKGIYSYRLRPFKIRTKEESKENFRKTLELIYNELAPDSEKDVIFNAKVHLKYSQRNTETADKILNIMSKIPPNKLTEDHLEFISCNFNKNYFPLTSSTEPQWKELCQDELSLEGYGWLSSIIYEYEPNGGHLSEAIEESFYNELSYEIESLADSENIKVKIDHGGDYDTSELEDFIQDTIVKYLSTSNTIEIGYLIDCCHLPNFVEEDDDYDYDYDYYISSKEEPSDTTSIEFDAVDEIFQK